MARLRSLVYEGFVCHWDSDNMAVFSNFQTKIYSLHAYHDICLPL